MNKKQAADQISTLFQSSFQRENYTHFLRNLLNDFEARNDHYHSNQIIFPDAYKQHINQYWRIGKYTDPEEVEMDLYVVEVKSLSKLDRARTALRNFSVRTMKTFGDKDHALIAFYAKEDGGEDWRFSYVKIEHSAKLDEKSGKVKLAKELTPAKRYSFLVGEHENSHTAQAQLVDLLAMDYANPTIEEIEKSFSVEKVTKEFFEQYKDLFVRLSEVLADQPYFRKETDDEKRKQVVAKFAKKLLGQIVFLYFLQKKGWLGVKDGDPWGKGDRKFLQNLFETANKEGENYYAEKLQFLFYEALASDREDELDPDYYQRFECKIPFLNGGLFEPDSGYDWRKEKIEISNSIFSNDDKTRAGDKGTGILDVFDHYNFTIKEDEPLEKEVAVDPEMLGKVFENMLEITERKSKGAFYTPREIVHYMCQESLIHYLNGEVGDATKSAIPKADIETLVRKGIFAIENDQRIIDKGKETDAYTFKLPESIRSNAELIDAKLADIKICDPAIGSGAFPLGMLHEILHARQALAPHLPEAKRLRPYDLKKHTIAHSIYGVDIDPSAIDIARLRLWLSLVVDEDDYASIDALPNLDYKIMQGNSLIEEYEGVKLFDEAFIQDEDDSLAREKVAFKRQQTLAQANFFSARNAKDKALETQYETELNELLKAIKKIEAKEKRLAKEKASQSVGLFDLISEARKRAQQLEGLHHEFFDVSSPARKRQLRDQITKIEWQLIEATLSEQNKTDALAKLEEYKESGEKPWFLWRLNFSEVFKQKGGFDIVIGNPPYGAKFKKSEKVALKKMFPLIKGQPESYEYFIYHAIDRLLNWQGGLSFINPTNFIESKRAEGLRLFLLNGGLISVISNFRYNVWKNNASETLVFLYRKNGKGLTRIIHPKNEREFVARKGFVEIDQEMWRSTEGHRFVIRGDNQIIKKISDSKTRLGDCCEVSQGIIVYKTREDSAANLYISDQGSPGWKKLLDTKSKVGKYHIRWGDRYLSYGEWLWCPRNEKYFNGPKIVFGRLRNKSLSRKLIGAFDNENFYNRDNFNNIISSDTSFTIKYVLALFNSDVLNYWYKSYFDNVNINPEQVRLLPLVACNTVERETIETMVDYLQVTAKLQGERLQFSFWDILLEGIVYSLYFPNKVMMAGKEILPHLGELTPLADAMSEEEKLAVIQGEFERLYDPNHPVRNHLETLDSVEEVRIIREALKK